MVSQIFWQEILKPKWFHKVRNKNYLKPLGDPAGPWDLRSAQLVLIFVFTLHEYHSGFLDFLAKIVLNTTIKLKKLMKFSKKDTHGCN